jgi:hypothetical protein
MDMTALMGFAAVSALSACVVLPVSPRMCASDMVVVLCDLGLCWRVVWRWPAPRSEPSGLLAGLLYLCGVRRAHPLRALALSVRRLPSVAFRS